MIFSFWLFFRSEGWEECDGVEELAPYVLRFAERKIGEAEGI